MHHIPASSLALSVLVLVFGLGCEEEGGPPLAEGESYVSLEVSGDELTAPVRFEGRTDSLTDFVSTDISLLSSDLDVPGDVEGFRLGVVTLTVRRTSPGTVDEDGFDINLVVHGFLNEQGTTAYSLRERDGSSSLTVSSISDERIVLDFEFDASPTQMNSTQRIFHVEGQLNVGR